MYILNQRIPGFRNSRALSPLSESQQDGVFYGQLGQADERQREALAKRLQSTPVGRALAKMGARISIEKAPPLHPLHWVTWSERLRP